MSGVGPTGGRSLARLRSDLSDRDFAVLRSVFEFRLLSGNQLQRLHFDGASPDTAGRVARRTLQRLNATRLLVRLDRRVGGVRAGSSGFVYAIGPVGERILGSEMPRRRLREPSERFLAHTLAIGELWVQIKAATAGAESQILDYQCEPSCWRTFTDGVSRAVLRPDFYAVLGVGELELRWFVEIDMATEHIPAVLRKCELYLSYYRSAQEQQRHGVFPRVLWLTTTEARADQIAQALALRQYPAKLFRVATSPECVRALLGDGS